MSKQFKVGDRVRIVNRSGYVPAPKGLRDPFATGNEGTVNRVFSDGDLVVELDDTDLGEGVDIGNNEVLNSLIGLPAGWALRADAVELVEG